MNRKYHSNPNTVALVPLRGGSKSIPRKNIRELCGKPLCAWALQAAVDSNFIDDVYVSTDNDEIRDVVLGLDLGIKIVNRPSKYATDDASTESVMLHFKKKVKFDRLVTIQATSPLITASCLDKAIKQFEGSNVDSMVSAVRAKRFFWSDNAIPINYNPERRPMRQDFKGVLMENGAFYVTKEEVLKKYKCRLGGKIGIYEMSSETAIEVDEPEDWDLIERRFKKRPM